MTFYRCALTPVSDPLIEPFESAEAAWFWYCQNQIARMEGARFHSASAGDVMRPCEADDIFTAVNRLYKARILNRRHLVVLGEFGSRLTVPSPAHEWVEAQAWNEAMAALTPVLKAKGIIW